MSANRVLETSSTTGTGNLTLAGAESGFRSFTSQHALNQRFLYTIDNQSGLWEEGIGYLSGTSTLVRETIQSNSAGTTSAISFTGTLQVFLGLSAQNLAHYPPAISDIGSDNDIVTSPHYNSYATSYTRRANQLYLTPYVNFHGDAKFTGFANSVNTASAGAVFRFAIYLVDETTGNPTGAPYMESDDIDATSSGYVTIPFTSNVSGIVVPTSLPSRFFIGIAFEDSTIEIMSCNWTESMRTWRGKNVNGAEQNLYQAFTMGTPTPGVASLPSIGTLSTRGENYPIGGLVL